nr:nitic oxide synthase - bovine [Bos taurus]
MGNLKSVARSPGPPAAWGWGWASGYAASRAQPPRHLTAAGPPHPPPRTRQTTGEGHGGRGTGGRLGAR